MSVLDALLRSAPKAAHEAGPLYELLFQHSGDLGTLAALNRSRAYINATTPGLRGMDELVAGIRAQLGHRARYAPAMGIGNGYALGLGGAGAAAAGGLPLLIDALGQWRDYDADRAAMDAEGGPVARTWLDDAQARSSALKAQMQAMGRDPYGNPGNPHALERRRGDAR